MKNNKIDLSQAKEIQGFPNYFIFPDNRGVWSNKSKKFLASQPTKKSPYKSVHLFNEGKSQRIAIHVLVAQEFIGPRPDPHPIEGEYDVEHWPDENPFNNHVNNLSYATKAQNNRRKGPKTGTFKGVSKNDKRYKKKIWRARLQFEKGSEEDLLRVVGNKSGHIGNYETEIEAAKAYDKKAYELDPKFAYLNFPQDYK
tara:strand:+ start:150 stop:743 length:594 start_codon:yes stop_codon:yes gene_type:complete